MRLVLAEGDRELSGHDLPADCEEQGCRAAVEVLAGSLMAGDHILTLRVPRGFPMEEMGGFAQEVVRVMHAMAQGESVATRG